MQWQHVMMPSPTSSLAVRRTVSIEHDDPTFFQIMEDQALAIQLQREEQIMAQSRQHEALARQQDPGTRSACTPTWPDQPPGHCTGDSPGPYAAQPDEQGQHQHQQMDGQERQEGAGQTALLNPWLIGGALVGGLGSVISGAIWLGQTILGGETYHQPEETSSSRTIQFNSRAEEVRRRRQLQQEAVAAFRRHLLDDEALAQRLQEDERRQQTRAEFQTRELPYPGQAYLQEDSGDRSGIVDSTDDLLHALRQRRQLDRMDSLGYDYERQSGPSLVQLVTRLDIGNRSTQTNTPQSASFQGSGGSGHRHVARPHSYRTVMAPGDSGRHGRPILDAAAVRELQELFGGQTINPDALSYERILQLQRMLGEVPRGVGHEVIDALPTRSFQSRRLSQSSRGQGEMGPFEEEKAEAACDHDRCSICLSEYDDGDTIRTLPCMHCYHAECVDKWLRRNRSCPMCKHEVDA